ncbi:MULTISPECIES: hypothetical protein, partial [unclassified Endozoicomonas]|uniref:hypothetical protein n=1 Tax=unclassified Endozoicomonas TaxID=2644528 RepID=UPI0021492C2D
RFFARSGMELDDIARMVVYWMAPEVHSNQSSTGNSLRNPPLQKIRSLTENTLILLIYPCLL